MVGRGLGAVGRRLRLHPAVPAAGPGVPPQGSPAVEGRLRDLLKPLQARWMRPLTPSCHGSVERSRKA